MVASGDLTGVAVSAARCSFLGVALHIRGGVTNRWVRGEVGGRGREGSAEKMDRNERIVHDDISSDGSGGGS